MPAPNTPKGVAVEVSTGSAPRRTTDVDRRRGLRRMRLVALSLLVLAALVYVLTLNAGGGWPYLHSAAEAAMVGAIADWFAVTALFRHPMGIPIPHTAIIPTRKLSLARSLQEFFTENFLSEPVIRSRVADARVSRRVGAWLAVPANSARVVDEIASVTRTGLLKIKDEDVSALIESELIPRLLDEPVSEIAGRLLEDVVAEAAHRGLIDLALSEAHRWLVTNPEKFSEILGTRAPWWTPQWLDERVTLRIHQEAIAWVSDIRDDPRHEARLALDSMLIDLAKDLQRDPATMERAEALKRRVLGQPQVVSSLTSLWHVLRRAILLSLEDQQSPIRARGVASMRSFGARMVDDVALQARVDGFAADAVVYFVARYGAELTTVITDTIDRWDGKEAARRIELHVGRDLQFIRINGTIVGGLAGLIIHALTVLL
ncbi:MAG: DUF445 domain-containing protein [Nocardioidaceae bacterium]